MPRVRLTRLCLLVLITLALLPQVCAAQAVLTFQQAGADTTDGTAYSFTGVDFGSTAAESSQQTKRYIEVVFTARKSGTSNCAAPSPFTIGGITATLVVSAINNPTNCNVAALFIANVPTGTTGTIAATMAATYVDAGIEVYRATGVLSATAHATGSSSAAAPTGTLTVPAYGFAIGGAITRGATASTATWTGLTEDDDSVQEATVVHTAASLAPTSTQAAMTVTATFTDPGESVGVWASWGGIGPVQIAATHKVTDTGSGSSNCEILTPCTLTRALAIAGSAVMNPGSYVDWDTGVYSQAKISATTGGVSGFPIRFVGHGISATRVTATRTSLPGASWSLSSACGGACTYTYEAAFDDVALYAVTLVAQRPPVSTWVPIEVDDRQTPYTTPSGRAFTLDEPVRYQAVTSVAEVEAQHCTFFHSGAANTLYIHPCREAAPTDADNYYASSIDWGKFDLSGGADYLSFENAGFEHAGTQAFKVNSSSAGIETHTVKFLATQLWVEGTGFIGRDLTLKEFYDQGPICATDPACKCYSSQYGGAETLARSCWNDAGGGDALVIGVDGSGTAYNANFDRVTVERNWNGLIAHNTSTMNHIALWGIANHASQWRGTGPVFTNSTCNTAQDCMYLEGNSWDTFTVEHNLLYNGTLFWLNRDGAGSCCADLSTGWTFRYNIVGTQIVDIRTEPLRTGDCNIWIPRSSGQTIYRVSPVDGSGSDPQYTTLAQIIAATDDEDHSAEFPFGAWRDGSLFANFANPQDSRDFSLTSAGAAAFTPSGCSGVRAGPDDLEISAASRRFRQLRARLP